MNVPLFKEGDRVEHTLLPERRGTVTAALKWDPGTYMQHLAKWRYRVAWDNDPFGENDKTIMFSETALRLVSVVDQLGDLA